MGSQLRSHPNRKYLQLKPGDVEHIADMAMCAVGESDRSEWNLPYAAIMELRDKVRDLGPDIQICLVYAIKRRLR
jgi:hypothetical protein